MRKVVLLIVLLAMGYAGYCQEEVLKIRAFKSWLAPANEKIPDYDRLHDIDILVVIKVKDGKLYKLNIYTEKEHDYDIIYKNKVTTIGKSHYYRYQGIDGTGRRVEIDMSVNDVEGTPVWDFLINYPEHTFYFICK